MDMHYGWTHLPVGMLRLPAINMPEDIKLDVGGVGAGQIHDMDLLFILYDVEALWNRRKFLKPVSRLQKSSVVS